MCAKKVLAKGTPSAAEHHQVHLHWSQGKPTLTKDTFTFILEIKFISLKLERYSRDDLPYLYGYRYRGRPKGNRQSVPTRLIHTLTGMKGKKHLDIQHLKAQLKLLLGTEVHYANAKLRQAWTGIKSG